MDFPALDTVFQDLLLASGGSDEPGKGSKIRKIDIFRGFVARMTRKRKTTAAAKSWTFGMGPIRNVRTTTVPILICAVVVFTHSIDNDITRNFTNITRS